MYLRHELPRQIKRLHYSIVVLFHKSANINLMRKGSLEAGKWSKVHVFSSPTDEYGFGEKWISVNFSIFHLKFNLKVLHLPSRLCRGVCLCRYTCKHLAESFKTVNYLFVFLKEIQNIVI